MESCSEPARNAAVEAGVLELEVRRISKTAGGARVLELARPDGTELPPFTAGAHIRLELPNGLQRPYSLFNHQKERDRYLIAVHREPASRGGSAFLCDEACEGLRLMAAEPINHFPLAESAPSSVLIAAGIGITPLWSMAQRLEALARPWALHYAAQRRASAALLSTIEGLEARRHGAVHLYLSRDLSPKRINLPELVQTAPNGAHLYGCGPPSFIDAFVAATAAMPADLVHLERFTATQAKATTLGFTLVMARSGRELVVVPGQTILDTLRANKVRATYSCSEGVCGACETRVIEGVPDHRDAILTDEERRANTTMMICCSGSKTDRLVLDL